MVDAEVGHSPHYTPATSSHTAPRGPQQKRWQIGRGEELDDDICEGLRESRKRWERKAEAEAAEKNTDMYFGKKCRRDVASNDPSPKGHLARI